MSQKLGDLFRELNLSNEDDTPLNDTDLITPSGKSDAVQEFEETAGEASAKEANDDADEALKAIEAMECLYEEVRKTISNEGEINPQALKFIALHIRSTESILGVEREGISNEELDKYIYSGINASNEKIKEEIRLSIEGLGTHLANKISQFRYAIKNLFSGITLKLDKMIAQLTKFHSGLISASKNKDKEDPRDGVVHPQGSLFTINGRADPAKVLQNMSLVWEEEIITGSWAAPMLRALDDIKRFSRRVRLDDIEKKDVVETLRKEISDANDVMPRYWKKSNIKVKSDTPQLELNCSDSIKVIRGELSLDDGLLPNDYQVVIGQTKEAKLPLSDASLAELLLSKVQSIRDNLSRVQVEIDKVYSSVEAELKRAREALSTNETSKILIGIVLTFGIAMMVSGISDYFKGINKATSTTSGVGVTIASLLAYLGVLNFSGGAGIASNALDMMSDNKEKRTVKEDKNRNEQMKTVREKTAITEQTVMRSVASGPYSIMEGYLKPYINVLQQTLNYITTSVKQEPIKSSA